MHSMIMKWNLSPLRLPASLAHGRATTLLGLLALAVLALACAGPAGAATTYTWDATSGNSTIEDGSGAWAVGTANWRNGTTYDQLWADSNDAVIGGGSILGGSYAIAVSGTVAPLSLAFRTATGGPDYTLNGGTINLGTGGMKELGSNTAATAYNSGTTTINSNISLTGAQTWTFGPTTTAQPAYTLLLNGTLTGSFNPTLNNKVGYAGIPVGTWVTLSSAGNNLKGFTLNNNIWFRLDNSVNPCSLTLDCSGLVVGNAASGTLADINNATLTINASGPLGVSSGNVAKGALIVRGSSTVTLNGGDIKVAYNNTSAQGYAGISGGTISAKNLLLAGVASEGFVSIRGGSGVTLSGNISVMDANPTNLATPSQGILTVADTATVSAATMTVANSIGATAGRAQTGQFYQTGGTVTIAGDIKMSADTTVSGTNNSTLNLAGSALRTGTKVYYAGSVATATDVALVNFHGGALAYTGNGPQIDFLKLTGTGSTASSGAYIYEGATIDDGGQSVTINQPLLTPNSGTGVTGIALGANTSKNYLVPPVVRITGTGTGASAIAQVDTTGALTGTIGRITGIVVTNPGVGYTAAPTINLDYGNGSNLPAATASIGTNAYTGGLTKKGAGTLTLTGANTYTGDTVVSQGTLSISQAYLADTADVKLVATLDLNTGGATDTIRSLYIGGVLQATGVWGAVGSGAPNTSALITGSGFLNVTNLYTVTYNNNGGTGSQTDPSSPYLIGSTVTVLGAGTMAKTGYIFTGWNTAANGSGTSYSPGSTFVMPVSNVTLYAQWIAVYTVAYDGNGNTGGIAPTDGSSPYVTGSNVIVLGNTGLLTKTGYTFTGWNTAADGSGTSYGAGSTFVIAANTTLYAQWTINNYTVTFDSNGGSAVPSEIVAYGNTATEPTPPTKSGSTFDGWYSDAGLTTLFSFATPITADTTLYAKWTSAGPVYGANNRSVLTDDALQTRLNAVNGRVRTWGKVMSVVGNTLQISDGYSANVTVNVTGTLDPSINSTTTYVVVTGTMSNLVTDKSITAPAADIQIIIP